MPYLTLKPSLIAYNGYDVGLGNRLRVVLGCKSLADLERRRFYYVWPTGPRFGPTFPELWQFDGRTVSRATSRLLARRYPYVDETLSWLDDAKRRERLWQIRTGSDIELPPQARPWQAELRSLVPSHEIASSVTRQFDEQLRGAPYVGVMIRAHTVAHSKTLDASPVEWFLARMHDVRQHHPGVRFFVSCDVAEVQQRVLAEIPHCYAQHDKGGYNTVEGVRAAVCDLYLLASASHLIGPHFSSFVEMAVHLADGRVRLETSASGGAPGIDLDAAGIVEDPLRPSVRSR